MDKELPNLLWQMIHHPPPFFVITYLSILNIFRNVLYIGSVVFYLFFWPVHRISFELKLVNALWYLQTFLIIYLYQYLLFFAAYLHSIFNTNIDCFQIWHTIKHVLCNLINLLLIVDFK